VGIVLIIIPSKNLTQAHLVNHPVIRMKVLLSHPFHFIYRESP
jgi:hypothetical protein